MKKTDPTGYDAALEAIPDGQLSSRQQRIAVALAMIQEGSSVKGAAEATGIPRSTLRGYASAVADLNSSESDGRTASIEALADQTLVAARIAAQRVTERLVDDEHEWRDADLINATRVMATKATDLHNRPKSSTDGASALAELLEDADITISKRDPARDAIDVTGEGE